MKAILFILMCLFSVSLIGQTETSSSYNYINVSGDNAYVLDTLTYSDGSLRIVKTTTQDSATLRATIAADTLTTLSLKNAYTNSFAKYATRVAAIQALKTADSLRKVYYTNKLTQQGIAIDSIVAN